VLTTKIGLLRSLQHLAAEQHVNIDTFFPRCYDLDIELTDFVLDFRRSAAVTLLQQHQR